jgi:translation elongation factor P/translation initiation factor 5A
VKGAPTTEKVQTGSLTKERMVMMNDKPCKAIKISKAKSGKHDSAKAIIIVVSLTDYTEIEQSFSTSDLIDSPIVKRTEYPCLGIEGDFSNTKLSLEK